MDQLNRGNAHQFTPAEIWLQLEQGMAEVDVMMRNLRASLGMTPAVTPTTDRGSSTFYTSSRRTDSGGAENGSGDTPMEHCAIPGISGTS